MESRKVITLERSSRGVFEIVRDIAADTKGRAMAALSRCTPAAMGRRLGEVYRGSERGAIDPAGMMLIAVGLIFLSVGMIIYPIVFDATDAVFAWTSANYSAGPPQVGYTIADFTGLSPILGIFPLLVLLGFVVEAVLNGIMGIQVMRGQGSGGVNPAALMMQSIGMIFLAVAMIVFPITLDGVAAILDGLSGAAGSYTGIASFAPVVPLLVLLAIVVGGVMVSFFGIKAQWKAVKEA